MELTRRSFLGVLGAGTAAALTGCAAGAAATGPQSGPAEGEITLLTPIFAGSSGKKMLEGTLLPAFRRQYPKITVKVDYTTYDALNDKLTTQLAGGVLSDVVMLGVGWVPPFAQKNVLAELPANFATLHDYDPRALDPSRYNGKLYALPVLLDARIGVYRKDMFAKAGIAAPPKNWQELRAIAKELTGPDRFGFDPFSIDLRQCWETLLFSNGGNLFDPSGRTVAFDDDRGVGALQLFKDVIADKSAQFAVKVDDGHAAPVQTGKAAMMVANSSLYLKIQQQNPELVRDGVFGTFLVQNTRPGMMQGGTLVAQSAHSKAPGAAQALVKFLAGPQATLPAATQRGAVVGDRSLRTSDYVKQNPFVGFAIDNLAHAQSEGGTPAWMEIREQFKPMLQSAIVGQRTPKQALDELAGVCKQAIARI